MPSDWLRNKSAWEHNFDKTLFEIYFNKNLPSFKMLPADLIFRYYIENWYFCYKKLEFFPGIKIRFCNLGYGHVLCSFTMYLEKSHRMSACWKIVVFCIGNVLATFNFLSLFLFWLRIWLFWLLYQHNIRFSRWGHT